MKRKAFQNIEAIRNKLSQQKGEITLVVSPSCWLIC